MDEILKKIMPNVMNKLPELFESTLQTIIMVGAAGFMAFLFGIVFAVTLVVTRKYGLKENAAIWFVLDKVINFFRSVPFIILITLLIPVTRFIAHTSIGVTGALVPLVFGTVPFFTRQIESALLEVDRGSIEAALSMGTGTAGIIFRVYLKESVPGIIRGVTITLISLIGLTAMAGAIGGGGLGDFAIHYGYQRYQTDVSVVTVVILILIVTLIQRAGDFFAKKASH